MLCFVATMQKRTHVSDEEENQESLKKARHDVAAPLSTSEELIVTNSDSQNDKISDLQAPIMLLSGHTGAVYSIAFDPTGQSLASSSFDGDICKFFPFLHHSETRFLVLWNTFGECENYNVLSGHKNAVLEVHWDSSGSKIISCSADKTVGLWDARKGSRIRRLTSHTGIVNSCSVAVDAPDLFSSGSDDCSAMIWDTRDKLPIQTIWHDYQVTSVCMDREGGHLYTGGIDNIIRRWDLRMPSTVPNLTLNGHGNTITGLSLNPEGTHLLSNGMDSNLFREYSIPDFFPTHQRLVWDIRPYVVNENQRYEKKFEGARHGAEQVLLKCNWSSPQMDGSSRVSCGSADRIVHIWDSTTAQPLYYLPGHKGSVNQVRPACCCLVFSSFPSFLSQVIFHPSQRIIASCGSDKQIFLGELS